MGYPDDDLRRANPRAALNTQPGADLAQAVTARNPDTVRPALNQQPGAALAEAVAERAPRVAFDTQPGAALAQTVAERAPRVAFNTQPGAALAQAVGERTTRAALNQQPGAALAAAAAERAPNATRAALNSQPGAALAAAAAERTPLPPAGDGRMVAQPRTPYGAGVPDGPGPFNSQLGDKLQAAIDQRGSATRAAFNTQPGAGLADALAQRADAARAGLGAQPGQALAEAVAARNPVPPRAALLSPTMEAPVNPNVAPGVLSNEAATWQAQRAALLSPPAARDVRAGLPQPGQAIARAAAARTPAGQPIGGAAGVAGPAYQASSPPLTPQQAPVTANPQWPNPNTGGAGAMSREATDWLAQNTGKGGAPAPAAPAAAPAGGDPGLLSRLRAAVGLGGPAAPPAAPAAPAAPGQPGAIGRAANAAVGSADAWKDWAQNSKTAANLGKAVRAVGTVGKWAAAPLGAYETYSGLQEGDNAKAALGALDTAAGAALFTPAAPAAGVYLAGRGGVAAGKMLGEALPESVRDGIGGAINKVANLFGGGVDDAAYKQQQAAYEARTAAAAQAAAQAAKTAAGNKPPAATGKTPPPAGNTAPPAATAPRPPKGGSPIASQADAQVAALSQRYNDLQQQLAASPIAHTVLGGGQNAIYYKDGSMVNLAPGQAVPDDAQQFHALTNALTQIENGTYRMPAATTAQAPATDGTPAQFAAAFGSQAQRVGQKLGVDPNLILAQWGQETGWGKSVIPGTNNLGNIKDFSGAGVAATDNMTGSRDNYLQFASPDAFADHYADLLARKYPGTVGAGADMGKFSQGLKGYAQDPAYASKLQGAFQTLGAINASSSTALQSPAVVTPDAAPALNTPNPSAAAAPGAPQNTPIPPFAKTPVQVLRGLQNSTALPNAGPQGGYTEVPTGVFEAGVRAGNASAAGRGPIADYLANEVQGAGFANNPFGGKLAEEALKNRGALDVANIGLEGHKVGAQAQRDVEASRAASVKKTAVLNPERVGLDATGSPIIKEVPYLPNDNGQMVRAVPERSYPNPNDYPQAIEQLRQKGDRAAFDRTFGPGAADYVLKGKK